jgi:hypothetical protein
MSPCKGFCYRVAVAVAVCCVIQNKQDITVCKIIIYFSICVSHGCGHNTPILFCRDNLNCTLLSGAFQTVAFYL